MKTFPELGLSQPLLASLANMGYSQPTEIQDKAIGVVLEGNDIMASAQTGSGKTAAFAIPILERLQSGQPKPRALVIVPTRELASQVKQQFFVLGKNFRLRLALLYGGVGYERQERELRRGADIIVATPGRLQDCIQKKLVDLSRLEILVLDEADRLLDMGFMPQVRKIVMGLPKQRQTLMFSATIDQRVEQLAAQFLRNPVLIRSSANRVEPSEIDQKIIHISEGGKDQHLLTLLNNIDGSVIVFARTRRKATSVTKRLRAANVQAEEIHGDVSQSKREKTLNGFRQGAFGVLVATDIAARGLDIPSISHVINYDLPQSPEDYIHRIGRTGRAGRSGTAISFVSDDQRHLLRPIERVIGRQLDPNSPMPKTLKPQVRRFKPRRRHA